MQGRFALGAVAFAIVLVALGMFAPTRAAPVTPSPIWDRIPSDEVIEHCAIEDRMPSGRCLRPPPAVVVKPRAFGPQLARCPIEDRLPSGGCIAGAQVSPDTSLVIEDEAPAPRAVVMPGECAIEDRLPSGRCPSVATQ